VITNVELPLRGSKSVESRIAGAPDPPAGKGTEGAPLDGKVRWHRQSAIFRGDEGHRARLSGVMKALAQVPGWTNEKARFRGGG